MEIVLHEEVRQSRLVVMAVDHLDKRAQATNELG
jgi:hypothetical protein